MAPVPPGATLGILGGGQLGRMTALAARAMGYRVHALDPDPACPARPVVERCVTAAFDDPAAAADLARGCGVVTLEIEQIAPAALASAARHAPLRPGVEVVSVVQDRGRQKAWLETRALPVGAWREVASLEALRDAVAALGGRCFVKACHGGYDGRGQAEVRAPADVDAAWSAVARGRCVVERAQELEAELSVLVARRPGGETVVFPVALNHHEARVLSWSVVPAPLPAAVCARAVEIGRATADAIGLEGLLAVELFLTRGGEVLVNELAPRPHNSFHATERACDTSQFEQLVRAACDLPLGAVEPARPAAIANLLGDLWLGGHAPDFVPALASTAVRLHLYGKSGPKPGRKMGHLSATGATPEEAVSRVLAARGRIAASAGPR